jgi:hypothetical protein
VSERTVFLERPSRHEGDGGGPGICGRCGGELVEVVSDERRRYCGKACRKAILALPIPEREARRAATPAGVCVACGADGLLPDTRWRCRHWRRRPELASMRRRSPGAVRFGDEGFAWLAGKLGLEPDDERLPDLALRLAEAGRLLVYLRPQTETIVAVAKAPDPEGAA